MTTTTDDDDNNNNNNNNNNNDDDDNDNNNINNNNKIIFCSDQRVIQVNKTDLLGLFFLHIRKMPSLYAYSGPAHGTAMREPCLEVKDNIIRFIIAQINDLMPGIW